MKFVMESHMEPIIDTYYQDGAKKLHNVVDKVLNKLHFYNVDKEDFYSLADEIFISALMSYEKTQSFDGFLYSCLYKKFCSEMTKTFRDKRCKKVKIEEEDDNGEIIVNVKIIPDEYLDAPVGDGEGSTLADMIQSNITVETEIFKEDRDCYSKKMLKYLDKLSALQKRVLWLTIAGYLPEEIREELHINKKQYADCNAAIHSYRNVSVLF